MAEVIKFPADQIDYGSTSMDQTVGKLSVPLGLRLRAFPFTNLPTDRASPRGELVDITLPMPIGVGSQIQNNYAQDFAKEAGTIAKLFTENGNLTTNLLNLPGRFLYDRFQDISGIDSGRRPMDSTEMDFISTLKRKYDFSWVLTATSYEESQQIIRIGNLALAYSIPSALPSSTRMIAPPFWTIDVVEGGSSNGQGGYSSSGTQDLNRDFLSSPKACYCTSVSVDRDASAVYTRSRGNGRVPISIALSMNFVEIDPLLKAEDSNAFVSRSELRAGINRSTGIAGDLIDPRVTALGIIRGDIGF